MLRAQGKVLNTADIEVSTPFATNPTTTSAQGHAQMAMPWPIPPFLGIQDFSHQGHMYHPCFNLLERAFSTGGKGVTSREQKLVLEWAKRKRERRSYHGFWSSKTQTFETKCYSLVFNLTS